MTELRDQILTAAQNMSADGLSPGKSGNVSARTSEGFIITPTGLVYDQLEPSDLVLVLNDGSIPEGQLKPSSEAPFHLSLYRSRPDINAIVHCHSNKATALACAGHSIPAFHYMVAVAGGKDIPLAPYATFGTEALASSLVATLTDRNACLMAHHGQIALGKTPSIALDLAMEIENLAAQYIDVLQLGNPTVLSGEEMDRVLEKFSAYGQQG
jgi:L-fuculose-phosphate aldolase